MQPNHNQQPQNNRRQSLVNYAKYSAFAFQMIGVFVLLALGGNWLDKKWKFNFPIFTLTGVFVALVAIFFSLYKLINQSEESSDK